MVEQLKNINDANADGTQFMFGKTANYEEVRVTLTNTQLDKLKSGTTLRITKKSFQDEELSHELFLTTRRKAKVRNTFANNMSTDINLSNV